MNTTRTHAVPLAQLSLSTWLIPLLQMLLYHMMEGQMLPNTPPHGCHPGRGFWTAGSWDCPSGCGPSKAAQWAADTDIMYFGTMTV